MKRAFYRSAALLGGSVLAMLFVTGCHSTQISEKPGEEMNSAMSAQQKATITEHKKRGEQ